MTKRLRLVGVLVQPQFMVDDGENLEPLQVKPLAISASDWPNVLALVAKGIDELRAQVEGPATPAADNENAESS